MQALFKKSILLLIVFSLATNQNIASDLCTANEEGPIYKIKWTSKQNLPLPHRNGKAAACSGKIYFIGGYCPETEDIRETSNYAYDPQKNTWTVKAKAPIGRSNFAIASYKNRIFVIGGDPLLPNNDHYLTDEDIWEPLAPLMIPRQHIDCGRIRNQIFVVGGLVRDTNQTEDSKQEISVTITDALEIYNIDKNKWTRGSPSPEARQGIQVAVVHGKLYTIGGVNKEGRISSACERYDPELNSWKLLPDLPVPILAPGIAVIKDKIFIIGGSIIANGSQSASDKVYVFDVSTNTWGKASPFPKKIQFPGTAFLDNRIYVIGGCNEKFQAYDSIYEGTFIEED